MQNAECFILDSGMNAFIIRYSAFLFSVISVPPWFVSDAVFRFEFERVPITIGSGAPCC